MPAKEFGPDAVKWRDCRSGNKQYHDRLVVYLGLSIVFRPGAPHVSIAARGANRAPRHLVKVWTVADNNESSHLVMTPVDVQKKLAARLLRAYRITRVLAALFVVAAIASYIHLSCGLPWACTASLIGVYLTFLWGNAARKYSLLSSIFLNARLVYWMQPDVETTTLLRRQSLRAMLRSSIVPTSRRAARGSQTDSSREIDLLATSDPIEVVQLHTVDGSVVDVYLKRSEMEVLRSWIISHNPSVELGAILSAGT